MRNRKFGVEIECGFGSNTADDYQRAVRLLKKEVDAKIIHPDWVNKVTSDGTLIEVRSPVLQGPGGFEELSFVMKLLSSNGGHITQSDGMHVHHDAPDFKENDEAVQRLIVAWKNNQELIYRFVPENRRNRGACPSIPTGSVFEIESDVKYVKTFKETENWRRYDLNIRALDKHGTIEIRLHQGCLDPLAAEAWIRFGQAFLNRAVLVDKPVGKVQTHEELLNRIRAHSKSRKHLTVYA